MRNDLYTKNKSIVSKYAFWRRIAVDFDGVCAKQTGDYDIIGDPVEGSIAVISDLRENGYYIVLWTSRTNALTKEELSQAPTEYPRLMRDMLDWLERHNFPYDEIWMGGQKPPCGTFIDDRCFRFEVDEKEMWSSIAWKIYQDRGIKWKK